VLKLLSIILCVSEMDAEMFCKSVNKLAAERYGLILWRPFKVPIEKIYAIARSADGEITPESIVDKPCQAI